jgi:hypothetical protein
MADIDLDAVKGPERPAIPDVTAEFEQDAFEQARQTLVLRSLQQDLELRQKFAWRIFLLIVVWLICILLILLLAGFALTIMGHAFKLSDTVLLGLIGGTTVNVLGIFVIVVRYLFPPSVNEVS